LSVLTGRVLFGGRGFFLGNFDVWLGTAPNASAPVSSNRPGLTSAFFPYPFVDVQFVESRKVLALTRI